MRVTLSKANVPPWFRTVEDGVVNHNVAFYAAVSYDSVSGVGSFPQFSLRPQVCRRFGRLIAPGSFFQEAVFVNLGCDLGGQNV